MFGIKFVKFEPGFYIFKYKGGKIKKEGEGLSFYYFAPTTSLVAVPIVSIDVPFIFNESTQDFQEISVQGQITYRISDPKKISQLLNYTLNNATYGYLYDDPNKLSPRLINLVQVVTKNQVKRLTLKEALGSSENLVTQILKDVSQDKMVLALGVEILGASILAVKPNPETAKALEAETRETILRESDQAIFLRRNSAVEKERAIKENELNTEIAIENKNREIKEKQMESEKLVQQRTQELEESDLKFRIEQEEKNKALIALQSVNEKQSSDAKAYAIASVMKAYQGVDPSILQTLASIGMDPNKMIALAFQGIAGKADKIGQLNITPDLLNNLLKQNEETH